MAKAKAAKTRAEDCRQPKAESRTSDRGGQCRRVLAELNSPDLDRNTGFWEIRISLLEFLDMFGVHRFGGKETVWTVFANPLN